MRGKSSFGGWGLHRNGRGGGDGLRLNEALELRPKDVDGETGAVRVLGGKGGRVRTPQLAEKAGIAKRSTLTACGTPTPPNCEPRG
jgi:hypothetical protein